MFLVYSIYINDVLTSRCVTRSST